MTFNGTTFLIWVSGIMVAVLAIAGLASLMAYPTKWVVNYLFTPGVLTSLFGTSQISFWQALALNFICGTLFKGGSSTSSSKKG